jgi:hypothetical protein
MAPCLAPAANTEFMRDVSRATISSFSSPSPLVRSVEFLLFAPRGGVRVSRLP